MGRGNRRPGPLDAITTQRGDPEGREGRLLRAGLSGPRGRSSAGGDDFGRAGAAGVREPPVPAGDDVERRVPAPRVAAADRGPRGGRLRRPRRYLSLLSLLVIFLVRRCVCGGVGDS